MYSNQSNSDDRAMQNRLKAKELQLLELETDLRKLNKKKEEHQTRRRQLKKIFDRTRMEKDQIEESDKKNTQQIFELERQIKFLKKELNELRAQSKPHF
jgi:chromosome segregation ATPase